jgi:phage terminase large subunit-like protein
MFQDPRQDSVQGFKLEWVQHYQGSRDAENTKDMNKYILVDPANEKKKKSDYTSIICMGAAMDGKDYLLDAIRDRLSLTERTDALFEMHKHWKTPGKDIDVGYEKYGKDSDIDHIIIMMNQENYRFKIIPLGGSMSKSDRIRRIIPDFEKGQILLPERLIKTNREGQSQDMIQVFLNEEYVPFPVGEHDDMLDNIARKKDFKVVYPSAQPPKEIYIPPPKRV